MSTFPSPTLQNVTVNGTTTVLDSAGVSQPITQGQLASTATGKGASLVGFLQSGTGAVARSTQSKLQDVINAADFSSTLGTGGDDYPAIQAALNACPSGGRVVLPRGKSYSLSAGLVANAGVFLDAETLHDVTTNANGSNAGFPRIVWAGGVSSGAMFTIKPATVGDAVWGGGTRDIYWDGNAQVASAVEFDNTVGARFLGDVRNVTFAGVNINSNSGSTTNFSINNVVEYLHFVWGVAAACQGAHGVALAGNGTTVPSTQQQIMRCSGLVYNGFMVYIAENDNCFGGSINSATQTGGTGGALYLKTGGSQLPNFNVFNYVNGVVKQENGVLGTTILHYISEGGGLYQVSGSSVWHGDLLDYVTGKRFASHTYKLRKKIQINNAALLPQNASMSPVAVGLQWYCTQFPPSGTFTASAVLAPDYDLDAGHITAVELRFASNGTSAGTAQFLVSLSSCADGVSAPIVTPQATVTVTPTVAAQYTSFETTATLTTPLATANGDTLFLNIQRQNAGTNTDAIMLLSVRVLWEGTGPNSSGSGTYYIPQW